MKGKLIVLLVGMVLLVGILSGCTEEPTANTAPVAGFTVPENVYVDTAFTFTDTSTDDVGVESWSWDFDADGVEDSTDQNPTHTYTEIGDYEVTLNVTDAEEETGSKTKTVTVGYTPPTASFIAVPDVTNASVNITVNVTEITFTDASTKGDANLSNWTWNFGDDSDLVYTQNATYTYSAIGNYTVTLTITDENDLTDTATAEITVTEEAT